MTTFDINQLLLGLVIGINLTILIHEHELISNLIDKQNPYLIILECSNKNIFICIINNPYTWLFIINITFIIYVIYIAIKVLIRPNMRHYHRQIDHILN
jgi:hypothetical protein